MFKSRDILPRPLNQLFAVQGAAGLPAISGFVFNVLEEAFSRFKVACQENAPKPADCVALMHYFDSIGVSVAKAFDTSSRLPSMIRELELMAALGGGASQHYAGLALLAARESIEQKPLPFDIDLRLVAVGKPKDRNDRHGKLPHMIAVLSAPNEGADAGSSDVVMDFWVNFARPALRSETAYFEKLGQEVSVKDVLRIEGVPETLPRLSKLEKLSGSFSPRGLLESLRHSHRAYENEKNTEAADQVDQLYGRLCEEFSRSLNEFDPDVHRWRVRPEELGARHRLYNVDRSPGLPHRKEYVTSEEAFAIEARPFQGMAEILGVDEKELADRHLLTIDLQPPAAA